MRVQGTAAIDWRTSPSYASTRGGYYGVTLANHSDDTFSFKRLDAELIQHVPFCARTGSFHCGAGYRRRWATTTWCPFSCCRRLAAAPRFAAIQTGRFRDRHSLLTSAEFRWIPSRLALDMAIFYDAGKVTRDRSDLDFNDLITDWGIGARFHGPTTTVLRIEMARGSEGWRLVFATSGAF